MTPPTWPVAPTIPKRIGQIEGTGGLRRQGDRVFDPASVDEGRARSQLERVVQGLDGLLDLRPRRTTQLIRMAEVEIISMLMPGLGQGLEHGGGHARVATSCRRRPR